MKTRKFSRRDFLRMSALTGAGVALGGCAPQSTTPEVEKEAVEAEVPVEQTVIVEAPPEAPKFTKTDLTIPSWWGPHEIEAAERAFQTIFKEQTGLNVKYEFIGSDFNAKVFTSLAADDPFDVITFGADFVPEYLERDVLLPLDDLIERDQYDLSNIQPQALDQWTYEGTVYGLTADMFSFHAYFNHELFEKAGLTPPQPTEEWTWDQLLEWSRALTIKEGDQVVQYGFGATGLKEDWDIWPNQNGSFVFGEGITESLLDDPGVIEAFDFYQKLIYEEETALKPAQRSQRGDLFLAGQLAILVDGTWTVGYLRSKKEEINFKWDVGLLPHNASAKEWYSPCGTAGWVIPKNAQDVNASWEALKFYASDTFAKEVMFTALSGLPCTKSALEGAWFNHWPENPPEGLTRDFYAKVVEHSVPMRWIKFSLGSAVIGSMEKLDLIYMDEESPSDLLPELAQEVNAELAECPWNK